MRVAEQIKKIVSMCMIMLLLGSNTIQHISAAGTDPSQPQAVNQQETFVEEEANDTVSKDFPIDGATNETPETEPQDEQIEPSIPEGTIVEESQEIAEESQVIVNEEVPEEEPVEEETGDLQAVNADEITAVADGNTVYIAGAEGDGWRAGNDSTGDGTRAKPYATIYRALYDIPAKGTGTIVVLSDMVISRLINEDSRAQGKNIMITGDNTSSPPVIKMTHTTTSSMFHLDTLDGGISLTLSNIVVDGSNHKTGNFGEFFVNYGSTLVLDGGAVLQNFHPRAINIRDHGTVIMKSGSKITGCTAGTNTSYAYTGTSYKGDENVGAAVYICPGGTFNMQGGTIEGNRATGDTASGKDPVAGVYAEGGSTIIMQGDCVIRKNYYCTSYDAARDVSEANVYLADYDGSTANIQLTGPMTEGADVGVYLQTMPVSGQTQNIAVGSGYTVTSNDAAYFVSDKATDAGIMYTNEGTSTTPRIVLANAVCRIGSTLYPSIQAAVDAVATTTAGTYIPVFMLKDFVITNDTKVTIPSGKNIRLSTETGMSPYTISREAGHTGILFDVANGGMLILDNIIIDGKNVIATEAMITVSGQIALLSGVTLQNAYNNSLTPGFSGGALTLKSGSWAQMGENATITKCYAASDRVYDVAGYNVGGSAILVGQGARFDMTGGSITNCGPEANNISNYSSSAIAVYGECTIAGGNLTGNTCSHGGAIGVFPEATLNYNGGTMENNNAYYDGGAIMAWNDSVINIAQTNAVNPPRIMNNKAGRSGSAVALRTGSQLTIEGGAIEGNEVEDRAADLPYCGAISGFSDNNMPARVTISGAPVIQNNYRDDTTLVNLVAHYRSGMILYIGNLEAGADVGIYPQNEDMRGEGQQFAIAGISDPPVEAATVTNLNYLHNDVNSSLRGRAGADSAIVWGSYVCKIGDVGYMSLRDAIDAIISGEAVSVGGTGDIINYKIEMLLERYNIENQHIIPAGKTVAITTAAEGSGDLFYKGTAGTSAMLLRYSSGANTGYTGVMLQVPATSSLILENITIDGNRDNITAMLPMISVNGHIDINEKTLLRNANNANTIALQNSQTGGAINLWEDTDSTITPSAIMNGGTIKNCFAASNKGDTFRDNEVEVGGSAVMVGRNTTFTMRGGEITQCGLLISGDSTSLPHKQSSAIAVYGICNITGGNLYDNQNTYGGAICSWDSAAIVEISGGTIQSNDAVYGGGIYASYGTVNIRDGANIAENTAVTSGSAICLLGAVGEKASSILNITGGLIQNNITNNSNNDATGSMCGAIDMRMTFFPVNTITVSGNPTIKDNLNADGVPRNLVAYKNGTDMVLKISNLMPGADVGIYPAEDGMSDVPDQFGDAVNIDGTVATAADITNLQYLHNDKNSEYMGTAGIGDVVRWKGPTEIVTITNNVENDPADQGREFLYTATYKDENNLSTTEEFALNHGESINITIFKGSTATFELALVTGYDTSYSLDGGLAVESSMVTITDVVANHTIAFTNTYNVVPPTSVKLGGIDASWLLNGILLLLLAVAGYIQYRQRKS